MMHIKKHIYLFILLILAGCIKPYEPELKDDSVQKYVVQGMVSSVEGYQEVNVSLTSSVSQPDYIALEGCQVEIIDDQNKVFTLNSFTNGVYRVWMNQEDLVAGKSYKVVIHTPSGEVLESAYDEMSSGPDVNDIYYEVLEIPANDPDDWKIGLQFYTDLIAGEDDSRYYSWKLTETWEYHALYPLEFFYDGKVHHVDPPDYSQMYCWTTFNIDEIFTLSTSNFSENSYARFPLNFVRNNTSRLGVLYSLLIHQASLTQNAYTYWDQLKQNSEQDGGLYSSQPMAIKGNLKNKTYPEKDVLGYFQASTVTTRRIFVYPSEDLPMDFYNGCATTLLEQGFVEINPRDYPAYMMSNDGQMTMELLYDGCIECTTRGGTTNKPYYWPIK